MAKPQKEKAEVRNLQKSKRSYFVRLPIKLVRRFGWQDGQQLVIVPYGKDKLVIEDWKK